MFLLYIVLTGETKNVYCSILYPRVRYTCISSISQSMHVKFISLHKKWTCSMRNRIRINEALYKYFPHFSHNDNMQQWSWFYAYWCTIFNFLVINTLSHLYTCLTPLFFEHQSFLIIGFVLNISPPSKICIKHWS